MWPLGKHLGPIHCRLIPLCGRKGKKCLSRHLVIWSRNHEYNVFSRKDLWSYHQSMGSDFRYALGKVLGTQDHLTLRLGSHHCVLCPNFIKNMFNTCIYTHTCISIHLSIHSWHHSSQNTYPFLKQKRAKHKGNPSIHITYEKPYHTSTTRQQVYHHNKVNILQTLIIHLSMFHHIIKLKP